MSDLTFSKIIIDSTKTDSLLVRQKNDVNDVLVVDTTNERVMVGRGTGFLLKETDNFPTIQFDTNDTLIYDRGTDNLRFSIGGTSRLEFNADRFQLFEEKLSITGGRTGTPGNSGEYISVTGVTFTDNNTAGSGTAASMSFNSIAAPTLAATNTSVTTTDAATLYIAGSPIAGTNQTITNPYSIWVDSGISKFDGDVHMSAGFNAPAAVMSAYGLIAANPADSTSGTTGSINTLGGVGITKSLFVGEKVTGQTFNSSSGSATATTGGVVLTTFINKTGLINLRWFNGKRLVFFDWHQGVNTESASSISNVSTTNDVTVSLNFNSPNMEIVATSASGSFTVYWDVMYLR